MSNTDVIITFSHIPDFFGMPLGDETPEQALERAREFYRESIQSYESHIVNYPDRADYWRECLEASRQKLEHLQIETWGDFQKRQRDEYINKPIKEITHDEWWDAYEVLPPCGLMLHPRFTEFYISEAFTGTFHSGYLEDKKTGKYYTAMIDKCDPSTKLCVRLGLMKIEPRNA